jgi:hypothetical protein
VGDKERESLHDIAKSRREDKVRLAKQGKTKKQLFPSPFL